MDVPLVDELQSLLCNEKRDQFAAAQKCQPARPQGLGRLRRTREGTSQGDTGLRTKLGAFFSSRYGSTTTLTNAGTESAPFLSVTLSLNR